MGPCYELRCEGKVIGGLGLIYGRLGLLHYSTRVLSSRVYCSRGEG
jgi:hypothetical protein